MIWIFAGLAVAIVLVVGFVAVGREAATLAATARPAVFEIEEAVDFIADAVPPDVAGRISHDDVRWVLHTDVDLLEEATTDAQRPGVDVVDEDAAIARVLAAAEAQGRELEDRDVVAVLEARNRYLEAIGAIGPQARGPEDPDAGPLPDPRP